MKLTVLLNQKVLWVFAVASLALILRLSAVAFLNIEPTSDAAAYMKMAISMLETGHMDDGFGNVAYYSAGYPIFLIPFFAVFGSSPETAQIANVILGVAGVLLVYFCAKQVLPNWKWALIPALIWATYPPAILYTEYIAKENLMTPLLMAQTLILLKFPNSSRQILLSAIFGAIFGIGLLVGAAIILTGALFGFVLLSFPLRNFGLRDISWRPVLVCALGCLLVLTPWLSYTTAKLGHPILNTNGGFNLYLGNNPSAQVHFVGIQDTPMGSKWHALREEQGEVKAMAFLKEMALDYIFENPGKTAWLALRKIAYFWTPPIHEGEGGSQSRSEELVRLAWAASYIVIMVFSILPLLFVKALTRRHAILYGTAVLYCVIHGAAYVIFRYRLPIMPIMSILAVSGLHFAYLWWGARKSPEALPH